MSRKDQVMRCSFRCALLFGAILLSGCGGAQHSAYTITDLGNPGDYWDNVLGIAINSSGKAVVISTSGGGGNSLLASSGIWSNGRLINLPSLGGTGNAVAAMNDLGMVVGVAGANQPFSAEYHAYSWQNGIITDLTAVGGNIAPNAVNNSGWIVGTTQWYTHAALLRNGQLLDLGATLGGDNSDATGINDSGDIVGNTYTTTNTEIASQAYLLKSEQVTHLVALGGRDSHASAINRNGQVAGWANRATLDGNLQYVTHAVLWQGTNVTDLGALGGDSSRARGLNNVGHVVGEAYTGTSNVGFLYRDGKMLDLNTLIPSNSGWHISNAWGINDAGQIVGQGEFGGNTRAFLLSPH